MKKRNFSFTQNWVISLFSFILLGGSISSGQPVNPVDRNEHKSPCGEFILVIERDAELLNEISTTFKIEVIRGRSDYVWSFLKRDSRVFRQSWPSTSLIVSETDLNSDGIPEEILIENIDSSKLVLEIQINKADDIRVKWGK